MPDTNPDGHTWIEEVLDTYERRLVAYARRLVGDPDIADDLVQDTLLSLCRTPLHPRDPRLGPWLFKVCRHRAIDRLRKLGRLHAWPDPDDSASPSPWTEPTRRVETADEVARLTAGLGELTPRQAEVVWLRFRADLAYRQIAEVTGLTVTNVGFLLHRALATLRRHLDQVDNPHRVRGAS